MCEFDPAHCDCHEWAQPKQKSLKARLAGWTAEYNAMVANGLVHKARPLKRRIEVVEKLLE
jgi:hypothetical protein